MTQDQFNSLISETVAMYSSSQGSILYLREQGNNSEPISICLSSLRNKNRIVPSECIVWDDYRVLYEGNIRSKKLYNKLKKYPFCCAEITSACDLNKRRGELCCLGCREECDNKKVCELINSIPDQIFDKEEFDKKIDDIIKTLPVDKEECCKESSLLDELILL